MPVPHIKICGITRLEDALVAAELGVWAVGFICWPGSPRFVDPRRARDIVRVLPPFVTPVGVFVDQSPEEIEAIATTVRLGVVQLHGSETPAAARALSCRVIKALPVRASGEVPGLDEWVDTLVLLDADDAVRRGGTGQRVDWTVAAAIARRRPVVLAGGLGPENVAEAVERVQPGAIDVSSGVETAPGIKDHARLRALVAAVLGAPGVVR
jgi:phosphoribosylanthranilate isomerase